MASLPLLSKVDLAETNKSTGTSIKEKDYTAREKENDSKEVKKFLLRKKERENLQLWQQFQESTGRRFETLFFISFPFSLILLFGSVQLYGLTMAGGSSFQMRSSHTASVILGSAFISLSVAYKGYADYKNHKEEMRRRIFGQADETFFEYGATERSFVSDPADNKSFARENFSVKLILASLAF